MRKIPVLVPALAALSLLSACGGAHTHGHERRPGDVYPLSSGEDGNRCSVRNPGALAPNTPCFP
ncbi:hypothetical protein C8N44_101210 [Allosediminivita pacifica]|uniref:Lipoprotein n=1 Tax=Allosediminivita pacifica TaxID=1267769 RepID=A0A2T6BA29_9RHOB|nr:hypothetical protein C8N44_101210 [Allosediminivita pacifica]